VICIIHGLAGICTTPYFLIKQNFNHFVLLHLTTKESKIWDMSTPDFIRLNKQLKKRIKKIDDLVL